MKNSSTWMLFGLLVLTYGCASSQIAPATPNIPIKTIEQSFNPELMLSHVETLSDDSYEGRRTGTKGAEMARTYIKQQLSEFNAAPLTEGFEQAFNFSTRGKSYEGVNVLAKITGSIYPDRPIVISAHYDHEGVKNGVIYNGADDDASGVAGLLALAEHFQTHPPKHSVILAFFDAEELGLQGSKYYVEHSIVPLKSILFNINLDMISRNENSEIYAVGVGSDPQFSTIFENGSSIKDIKILLGHDGSDGKQDWTSSSDHGSFHNKGIPFIYFGVEDHKDYHQPTDDYDNIQPVFLTNVVGSIIAIFEQLDKMAFK